MIVLSRGCEPSLDFRQLNFARYLLPGYPNRFSYRDILSRCTQALVQFYDRDKMSRWQACQLVIMRFYVLEEKKLASLAILCRPINLVYFSIYPLTPPLSDVVTRRLLDISQQFLWKSCRQGSYAIDGRRRFVEAMTRRSVMS